MYKRAQPVSSQQRRLEYQFTLKFVEPIMPQVHTYPSIPKSILLPIDFSPSSQTALDTASDLAEHYQATLFLVNAVPCLSEFALTYSVPDVALQRKMKTHAEHLLAKCHAALTARGIKSSYSVEVGNDVAASIIDVVEREHIDMVVISTHGVSGWHPLVFGSIAEKVVKLVQCPLLLLHSPNPETHSKSPSSRSMEWW
jgi:nucleotide-binding universal stress UspA family protein